MSKEYPKTLHPDSTDEDLLFFIESRKAKWLLQLELEQHGEAWGRAYTFAIRDMFRALTMSEGFCGQCGNMTQVAWDIMRPLCQPCFERSKGFIPNVKDPYIVE